MSSSIHDPAYQRLLDALVTSRRRAGLGQSQVAERLGMSLSWVSSVERHQIRLDLVSFCRLSDIVGLDPVTLIRHLAEELREAA